MQKSFNVIYICVFYIKHVFIEKAYETTEKSSKKTIFNYIPTLSILMFNYTGQKKYTNHFK